MRQPAHAANFLLSPLRRDPRWVMERQTPLVQNAIKYFLTQLGGERWGALRSHIDVWQSLWAFHCKPPREQRFKEPTWDTFGQADASLTRKTASQWWATYGCNHKDLQKIATRVTNVWSTTTPSERNWSSLDLIHSKRRNNLSSESLAKLVYVHWNMQLQSIPRSMKDGWVDVQATFFDDPEPPSPNDGAILPGPLEMTEEGLQWQARLTKTRRGRILKDLDSDDSAASSSDDDIIWSEKGGKRTQPLRDTKGKAPMGEEDEEAEGGEEEDSYADSDFELLPPEDSDKSDDDSGTLSPAADLLLPSQRQCEKERDCVDEEERAAAKALADKDRVRVQQRIEEDAAQRMAVRPPTRVNTHGATSAPPSACTTGGLHTNEVQQHHQLQPVQVLLQQTEKQ
ncbi:hypothetical protein CBR_g49126 [Chara braunii]|uniref:HAT C-terminal dimerisation domain-containing protein n=1 Tax=Chara braunii TaxID=69332 RepID=A0A388K4T9_CHABU|nr:hypothetical protein CBR_g49126 [Chara braunii]|eukprot:GBG65055.1 hypothetical protein CBR_g49126 [Chara braunii]